MSNLRVPKMSNRFAVYFTAITPHAQDLSTMMLSRLSTEVVSVKLPKQAFQTQYSRGPSRKLFRGINMTGPLVLTLEDDVKNQVAEAIEFASTQCQELNILVVHFDRPESNPIEAYLFGAVRFDSVEFSELDYHENKAQRRILSFVPKYAQYHQAGTTPNTTTELLGDI